MKGHKAFFFCLRRYPIEGWSAALPRVVHLFSAPATGVARHSTLSHLSHLIHPLIHAHFKQAWDESFH